MKNLILVLSLAALSLGFSSCCPMSANPLKAVGQSTAKLFRCGTCVRLYWPKKDCCGTTSESTRLMASAQGSVGSPNIGLIPTMKPIAP